MAAVDDYLEVREEHRERVAALVKAGQLAVGPWQILLDEFLVSGENIVRNLELGWARAEQLGGAMRVGYLPDEFGHCAQMPQILAAAGFEHACLWRGVPASVEGHASAGTRRTAAASGWSTWPTGTATPASCSPTRPGSASGPPRWSASCARRSARNRCSDVRHRPLGAGAVAGQPGRRATGHRVRDGRAPVRVRITTLAEYLAGRDPGSAGLPVVSGELRSHARANILPGVLSVRPQLKRALAAAERMVERYAEPFATLFAPDCRAGSWTWPGRG